MAHAQPTDLATTKAKIDGATKTVANSLEQVGEAAQATTKEVGTWVADTYQNARGYVQNADLQTAATDLKELTKRHPLKAAAVGLGIGLLLGKFFRRA